MENQIIQINLVPNMSTPAVVQVSQYDVGRPLVFKVYDGTSPADLTGVTAVIEGTKRSGLGFSESGTVSDNTVTLDTTLAMTQEDGSIPAEIRFSKTGEDVGTANFILAVEKTPHADGTTDGTQETMANLETRLQAEIDDLSDRIDDIEAGGSGLSSAEKQLILTLFCKAAYAEDDAGVVYDALENLWTTTTRTITYNLSHVSSSNTTASVESGQSYTTTLTASTNYTINSVTVTMGGVDITSTAYSSGTVSIPSVTGNIVITASAVLAAQSITATYTQSGTVYDTDSLDSLKPDLVVTANYSGGTSETVPASDYTLSGTLTEGTSTITVSYAGLTTTFNVTVTEWQPITVTLTWTGSGTDKKSNLIDATEYDAYFTLPFVADSPNLVSGATAESLGCREYVEIYDDSAGTHRIGYYYTDTKQIESGRTTANSPYVPFDTEEIFVPRGYYGKIVLVRVNTDVWYDNSNFLNYLNANATEAVMR